MYIKYGFKIDEKEPKINKIHWSLNPPVNPNEMANNKKEFNVGRAKLREWIKFVIDERFVQFGGVVYKQSPGIFMGTAPAPDLANDFAFMHDELNFLKTMINKYLLDTKNNIEPLYPLEFIEQYDSNTKRFIGDILTVAPGLPSRKGSTFEQIIKREGGEGGVYGGMYPEYILDDEGEQVANPVVSITKEQRGQTVHFLDMEILQSTPGVSQIRMYDKRDDMETLEQNRRYPHIETRLSKKVFVCESPLPTLSICN